MMYKVVFVLIGLVSLPLGAMMDPLLDDVTTGFGSCDYGSSKILDSVKNGSLNAVSLYKSLKKHVDFNDRLSPKFLSVIKNRGVVKKNFEDARKVEEQLDGVIDLFGDCDDPIALLKVTALCLQKDQSDDLVRWKALFEEGRSLYEVSGVGAKKAIVIYGAPATPVVLDGTAALVLLLLHFFNQPDHRRYLIAGSCCAAIFLPLVAVLVIYYGCLFGSQKRYMTTSMTIEEYYACLGRIAAKLYAEVQCKSGNVEIVLK